MDNLISAKILLVEDNPADARLIIDYFKKSGSKIKIEHLVNGADALDYLYQKGKYKNTSLPHIIILDMNLPKVEGMTVLKTIKEDKNLINIPVIVFGTSNDPLEVKKAYKLHANCYIVKPLDFDEFNNVLKYIEQFWINLVNLPPKHN
ncbi:MAG: response regulator [Methanobacterium sp.]